MYHLKCMALEVWHLKEETASTHFNYAEKNQEHVVWFEDDRSL